MGKSKNENAKTLYVGFRVNKDEKEYIQKLAFEAGLSETDLLRKKVLGAMENDEKQRQAFKEELINIRRQNFIISKLLIMVALDINRNDQIADMPITEKSRKRIADQVDEITEQAKKIK